MISISDLRRLVVLCIGEESCEADWVALEGRWEARNGVMGLGTYISVGRERRYTYKKVLGS